MPRRRISNPTSAAGAGGVRRFALLGSCAYGRRFSGPGASANYRMQRRNSGYAPTVGGQGASPLRRRFAPQGRVGEFVSVCLASRSQDFTPATLVWFEQSTPAIARPRLFPFGVIPRSPAGDQVCLRASSRARPGTAGGWALARVDEGSGPGSSPGRRADRPLTLPHRCSCAGRGLDKLTSSMPAYRPKARPDGPLPAQG
jgi:hypothetical protein